MARAPKGPTTREIIIGFKKYIVLTGRWAAVSLCPEEITGRDDAIVKYDCGARCSYVYLRGAEMGKGFSRSTGYRIVDSYTRRWTGGVCDGWYAWVKN